MATFRIDDFKSKLTGGGARANLFKVTLSNLCWWRCGINIFLMSFDITTCFYDGSRGSTI